MYYLVESDKSCEQAVTDLEEAVAANGYGVLHEHDLGAKLREKGVPFDKECRVFAVCNPTYAAEVLSVDLRLNMALPCRISVFTEEGRTFLGLIRPVPMIMSLSQDETLHGVAEKVERDMIRIVDQAK